MIKKRYILGAIIILIIVHWTTWAIWGDELLLKRSLRGTLYTTRLVEFNKDHNPTCKYALCTNLKGTFSEFQFDKYFSGSCVDDSHWIDRAWSQINKDFFLVIAVGKYFTPWTTHLYSGYWVPGTDIIDDQDEFLVWAFVTWIPIWNLKEYSYRL